MVKSDILLLFIKFDFLLFAFLHKFAAQLSGI